MKPSWHRAAWACIVLAWALWVCGIGGLVMVILGSLAAAITICAPKERKVR